MEINKVTQAEKTNAMHLVWEVFLEFEAPEYTKEGVKTFRDFITDKNQTDSLEIYGAYETGELAGVIATRNEGSHIALFFVDKKYHRQGIGRKLWEAVLRNSPAETITVHSSPYAGEIYRKLGFTDTDGEQTEHGISYISMQYQR
ncbi:MAG: GNAT family N-acetyltransferase [Bacillota bacterium]